MNNSDKVIREAQQFFKSVCTYIKDEEYNKEFFSTICRVLYLAKVLKNKDMIKIWMDDDHWKIWLLVR